MVPLSGLLLGERYSISLDLSLPSSETNRAAGMFVACAEVKDAEGEVITTAPACRLATWSKNQS